MVPADLAAERPWLRHYQPGVPAAVEIPEITVPELLRRSAETWPDRPALVFYGRTLTYRELDGLTDRFAAALQRLGAGPGTRVSLHLPNCPQFLIAYYGALRAGGVVVPHSPLYVEREIAQQLGDSGAEIAVALDLLLPRIQAVQRSTAVRHVVATGVHDFFSPVLRLLYPLKARREGRWHPASPAAGVSLMADLLRRPAAPLPVVRRPDDLAVLLYTGGTTGTPKGAMLTHRNLVANVTQSVAWFPAVRPGRDTLLAVIPFFHVYGMTSAMNFSVVAGARLVPLPRFFADEVLDAIRRYRPNLFPGVPTMYNAIVNHPRASQMDMSSIGGCISGAAPLPAEVQHRFESLTGGRLVEGYGLTEASPVTHCNPIEGTRKIGTIGVPFPNTEARIVDAETGDRVLPVGEVGELVIRGPQVMHGYWNRPEETAQTLRDGWLHTGDLAAMDEDGFFRIVERKKEMILVGGLNVYPREVEEVLYEHPAVREAAAIGVADAYRGEAVKAFVVLKEGASATADEIVAHCRERLARYKVPAAVEFRSELPKSLVGKVLRRVLAEEERAKAAGPAAQAG